MTKFDLLDGHQYMSLKTFRKSGEAVATPVWFAREGDKLYVTTNAHSGKVKRIRNNPQVELAPCNSRGKLLGKDYVTATARILPDGAESQQANRRLSRKYTIQYWVIDLLSRVRREEGAFLEITPA